MSQQHTYRSRDDYEPRPCPTCGDTLRVAWGEDTRLGVKNTLHIANEYCVNRECPKAKRNQRR